MMVLGLLALSSGMVFLGGCAPRPCLPARPMAPPAVLLQTIDEPVLKGHTNGDLAAWALELREALRLANSDKAALREWATRFSQ